jgi:UDP-3-O-[3-hydroxymyristoyl] glucosamine N-acyltransferase
MTLLEIAGCLGIPLPQGVSLDVPIVRVSSLEDAGPGDIVFFEHPSYLRAMRETAASVAIVPLDFSEEVSPVLLRVPKPSAAFTAIVEKLSPPTVPEWPAGIHPTAVLGKSVEIDSTASIHPGAVIESGVRIGPRTVVGAHSFVGRDSRLGEDCIIYPNVVLREHCILGSRVIIHSGAVIGSDGFGFQFDQGRHRKVPQIGHVQIDDDVEVGACTTIDRARFGRTWIQTGTKIDNLVQIAHNVVIGPHCLIVAQTGISGSARLGRYVTLAGQVGVVGHVEIGDEVVVAAKSGVSKDTAAKQQLMGMFGIPIKEARELVAHYHRLPKTAARIKALEAQIAELRSLVESMQAPSGRTP